MINNCLNCGCKLEKPWHKFCYECYIAIGNDLNYLVNRFEEFNPDQTKLNDYYEEYECEP